MRALILVSVLLGSMACATKPSERDVFTQGLREGYRMGHAPQILPIQINPVTLTPQTTYKDPTPEAVRAAEEFMDSFFANEGVTND